MDNFNEILTQPFYNTIELTEAQWKDKNDKAIGLQRIIEQVFNSNPELKITGWQMKHFLDAKLGRKNNLLSVRRSISNLKNETKLTKLSLMRKGDEGEMEHFYCLKGHEGDIEHVYRPGEKSAADFAAMLTVGMTQKEIFNND